MGHALGEAARVDEDERGAVFADEVRDTVVDLAPHFIGGDGTELVARNLDRELHGAAVADVDDAGIIGEEGGDVLDGFDGGGQAYTLRLGEAALLDESIQAGEGEGEVRSALVVGDRMDLIDDEGADLGEHLAGSSGGDQDEERFGSGNEDVRAL